MTLPAGTANPTDGEPGIAVLGGSFDPPHASHRKLAVAALDRLPIGQVRVIPAGDHPHKRAAAMTEGRHRLAMCRLAFGFDPRIVVDDREVRRAGPSFTVDTLAELRAEHPRARLYFLIGSDNLPLLPTWRDHHRVLGLATVVTYPRLGHPVAAGALERLDLTPEERRLLLANVLDVPADAFAASELRRQWRAGSRDSAALDPAVAAYVEANGLYR